MAFQDRGHVTRIGDIAHVGKGLGLVEMRGDGGGHGANTTGRRELRLARLESGEQAPGREGGLDRDCGRGAGQDGIERVLEVGVPWCWSVVVVTVLIVDCAPVADVCLGVDHDYFVGSLHEHGIGLNIAGVVQDREAGPAFIRPRLERFTGVAGSRGHSKEPHTLRVVLFGEFGEPWQVLVAEWTVTHSG